MMAATLETDQTETNAVGEERETSLTRNNRGTNLNDRESSSMALTNVTVIEGVRRSPRRKER